MLASAVVGSAVKENYFKTIIRYDQGLKNLHNITVYSYTILFTFTVHDYPDYFTTLLF